MTSHFHDFLQMALQESGLTSEGMCLWIAAAEEHRQTKPGESDGAAERIERKKNSIRERIRLAKQAKTQAIDFPFLSQIIQFFDSKDQHLIAAAIRHIHRQQDYDRTRPEYKITYTSSSSSLIKRFVYPDGDVDILLNDFAKWKKELSNRNRQIFRESVDFFFTYANSPMHAPIRRQIAADLARAAISFGEYGEAYVIATTYINNWNRLAEMKSDDTHLVQGDLYNYFRCLQTRAVSISFLFSYAPLSHSTPLFKELHRKVTHFRRIYKSRELDDMFKQIRSQNEVLYLRMLCRARMNLSVKLSSGSSQYSEDNDTQAQVYVESSIRRSIARLNSIHRDYASVIGDQSDRFEPFLLFDTLARASALSVSSRNIEEHSALLSDAHNFLGLSKDHREHFRLSASTNNSFRSAYSEMVIRISEYYSEKLQSFKMAHGSEWPREWENPSNHMTWLQKPSLKTEELSAKNSYYELSRKLSLMLDVDNPFLICHNRLAIHLALKYLQAIALYDLATPINVMNQPEMSQRNMAKLESHAVAQSGLMFKPDIQWRLYEFATRQAKVFRLAGEKLL